jgi:hypothetical protein
MLLLLCIIILLSRFSPAVGIDLDGDLSEGDCARFLCPKYYEETRKYFWSGCEGSFSKIVAESVETKEMTSISWDALIIYASLSFLASLAIGIVLGREMNTTDHHEA